MVVGSQTLEFSNNIYQLNSNEKFNRTNSDRSKSLNDIEFDKDEIKSLFDSNDLPLQRVLSSVCVCYNLL